MNKYMLLAAAALTLVFTGCKSDEPFDTQSADDYPRILYPVNESGTGTFTYTLDNPDVPLHDSVIVTPSKFTTVQWLLDEHVVVNGTHINMCLPAGKYNLKIVATTQAGKSTSRWGTVTVIPYAMDPYSEAVGSERIVAPGAEAVLLGQNLTVVKKIGFLTEYPWASQDGHTPAPVAAKGVEITDFTATDTQIDYVVPAELAVGAYYVAFYDEEDKLYGANIVNVVSSALVIELAEVTEGGSIDLKGIFLNQVKSLKLQGEAGSFDLAVTDATESAVSVALPEAAKAGTYTLTGVLDNGSALQFATENGIVEEVVLKISPSGEVVVWTGSQEINWGDANLTIELAILAEHVGEDINIYYELVDMPEGYHQMAFASAWSWKSNPLTDAPKYDPLDDEGKKSFKITKAMYDACADDGGGMLCVGYGYKITKVSIGGAEQVIYKGPSAPLAWSALEFKDGDLAALGLEVGNTVTVYLTADAGAAGAIATTWWNAINTGAQWEQPEAGGIKTEFEEAGEYTLSYKIETMQYIDEQGFAVVGNGFVVDKITKK